MLQMLVNHWHKEFSDLITDRLISTAWADWNRRSRDA
jgi:hypothetical protein